MKFRFQFIPERVACARSLTDHHAAGYAYVWFHRFFPFPIKTLNTKNENIKISNQQVRNFLLEVVACLFNFNASRFHNAVLWLHLNSIQYIKQLNGNNTIFSAKNITINFIRFKRSKLANRFWNNSNFQCCSDNNERIFFAFTKVRLVNYQFSCGKKWKATKLDPKFIDTVENCWENFLNSLQLSVF